MKLIQHSFNSGVWSPLLEGRTDLDKYRNALYRSENFLIDPRGPLRMRPGFKYIAGTKTNSKKAYLLPFKFSVTQAYILEFGDYYIRFYKDQAQIQVTGTPYEVVSPYAVADIPALKYTQSNDVLYLTHPGYAPRKLSRAGHTDWTLSTINFRPPALSAQGLKPATTLTPAATTGTGITFTAGASVFLAGDDGRIISSGAGRASIVTYVSGTEVTCDIIDDFASTDPIPSQSWTVEGSPSGTLTPGAKSPVGRVINCTNSLAAFRTADVGKYIRINSGLVKITSYTSTTIVKGEILKELTATTGSTTWSLESAMWSSTNGYPGCGTFFEDRLFLCGSTEYPETIWGSVVGDYENFTPGVDDSDAVEFTLGGRDVHVVRWVEPGDYLLIGASGGEWRVGPEDSGDPLTPLNIVAKQQRNFGSANILPVAVSGSILFVQSAGRKLRELTYQWESESYVAPDMTRLAEHITTSGIAGVTYQQEPFSIIWTWLNDGTLLSFTYLRDEEVVGWGEHPIDGTVESMAVIPGDGYDEVWAVINRTIGGSTVRYIEMMEMVFDDSISTFSTNKGLNAFLVDCGITYNSTATTTITGLSHLEGEEVVALADGAVITGKTVASGQITLPLAASVVHVGLPYTATAQLMRLNVDLKDGTSQGRLKKIDDVTIRVVNSGIFKCGPDADNLTIVRDKEQSLIIGGAYPLFTGDLIVGYDNGWERDARIMIVQDKPLPLTVAAVITDVDM